MTTLDDAKMNELFAGLLGSTGVARTRYETQVIEYVYVTGVLGVWANSLASRHGDIGYRHREDLVGVIAVALTKWIQELDPSRLEDVRSWPSFMFRVASFGVRDYLNSGQVTVASKMSAFARRTKYIGYAKERLQEELGREPTREEIIEYANIEAHSRLKDPKRQGALIDHQDFGEVARPAVDVDETFLSSRGADHNIAERVELQDALRNIITECRRRRPDDAQLIAVINEWVDIVASGDEPTPQIVARSLGISITGASQSLDVLNEVMAELRG